MHQYGSDELRQNATLVDVVGNSNGTTIGVPQYSNIEVATAVTFCVAIIQVKFAENKKRKE